MSDKQWESAIKSVLGDQGMTQIIFKRAGRDKYAYAEAMGRANKHAGGRPQGVTMPCGWGCGAHLTARMMREHFTSCPAKPVPTPKRPV